MIVLLCIINIWNISTWCSLLMFASSIWIFYVTPTNKIGYNIYLGTKNQELAYFVGNVKGMGISWCRGCF